MDRRWPYWFMLIAVERATRMNPWYSVVIALAVLILVGAGVAAFLDRPPAWFGSADLEGG